MTIRNIHMYNDTYRTIGIQQRVINETWCFCRFILPSCVSLFLSS